MKKNIFLAIYGLITALALTSCNGTMSSSITATSTMNSDAIIMPYPTQTATPLPTSTPIPVPISEENFFDLQQASTMTINQSEFVDYTISKLGFKFEESGLPDGEYSDASFLWLQMLENGDLVGLLMSKPLTCGVHEIGVIKKTYCSYNRYTMSLVNLTQQEELWTQYQPINQAGAELNELLVQLGIENFKPGFGSGYNGGYLVFKWTDDQTHIVFPIGVVNSLVIKDALTGENTLIINGGPRSHWIGALSPDNTKFAYVEPGLRGGMDNLKIMDMETQKISGQFKVANSLTDLVWSADGSMIAVGKNNGSINIFYLTTQEEIFLIERRFDLSEQRKSDVSRLAFSHDGTKLAFTETYYNLKEEPFSKVSIYDIETRKEINSYTADFFQNGNIRWSVDDTFVITTTDFKEGKLVLLSDTQAAEMPLNLPDGLDEYRPTVFTSWLLFNADQTQLTVLYSVLDEAVVSKFEIVK